jgi:uroporphyrinogen decarboxylase
MGLDALNPIQVSAKQMDPLKIKREVGKEITLWGAINMDDLVTASPKEIREIVRRRVEELGSGGGFVLSATHNILCDVPSENLIAMLEAAGEAGRS